MICTFYYVIDNEKKKLGENKTYKVPRISVVGTCPALNFFFNSHSILSLNVKINIHYVITTF